MPNIAWANRSLVSAVPEAVDEIPTQPKTTIQPCPQHRLGQPTPGVASPRRSGRNTHPAQNHNSTMHRSTNSTLGTIQPIQPWGPPNH